ncbi:MAG: NAD-dependent epimerase/dehydratase family protein [Candidatus Thermoplasmatota archaeon]|nr:NAD-dependent epimerase/dehydratase family protein [Candidatus Thermoplasmatota archaeon]
MKAFVTGGSGHVGGNLVRHLLDAGYQVRCLVRKDVRALDGLDVELVNGSLTDSTTLIQHMMDVDVVFHAAAFVAVEKSNEDLMRKINVGGTTAMVEAALEANVPRFIHFSSVHAFSQRPTSEALTEERPLVSNPKSAPYDRTKAAAQEIVYEACNQGLNASIIHPTGIIGPFDFKPSRMGQVLCDMANGKMPITINTGFNWVDVRDVCIAAINCIDQGKSGQHYIVPGQWGSMKSLADVVSSTIGRKTTRFTFPFWTAYLALPFAAIKSKITGKRPSFSRGSLHALAVQCRDIPGTLARDELDHHPRKLSETVRDTVEWMQTQGRI